GSFWTTTSCCAGCKNSCIFSRSESLSPLPVPRPMCLPPGHPPPIPPLRRPPPWPPRLEPWACCNFFRGSSLSSTFRLHVPARFFVRGTFGGGALVSEPAGVSL